MSARDRQRAFEEIRGLDRPAVSQLVAENPAATRIEELRDYRERMAAERLGAGAVGLAPVAGQPNWIPLGPAGSLNGQTSTRAVVSGRVPSLAVSQDGQRIYVGSANGGVWASTDGGRSWTPMSDAFDIVNPGATDVDSLACGAIALVDGGTPDQDRLYVGTGEADGTGDKYLGVGMLMSPDGGGTWQQEAVGPPPATLLGRGAYEIAVDPVDPEHAIVATNGGLFRRSAVPSGPPPTPPPWTEQVPPTGGSGQTFGSVVAHHAAGTTTFYAALRGGGVISSTTTGGVDSGWTPLVGDNGFPTGDVGLISLAISSGPTPTLYALVEKSSDHHLLGVWRIDVGHPRWTQVSGMPAKLFGSDLKKRGQGSYDQAIVVDTANQEVFYIGGAGSGAGAYIHRCTVTASGPPAARVYAAAEQSIGMSAHPDVHVMVVSPADRRTVWVGCDGGVFVGRNAYEGSGDVFEPRNSGLSTMTMVGLAHHPTLAGYVFCGAQDNGGLRYGAEEVWDHHQAGDGGGTVINWASPRQVLNGYVRGDVRQFNSDGDRYQTTNDTDQIHVDGETSQFYPPIEGVPQVGAPPDPIDAKRVAWGGQRVYLNDRFGESGAWNPIPEGSAVFPGNATATAMAFASSTRLWVGLSDNHLWEYTFSPGPPAQWAKVDRTAPSIGAITSIAPDPAIVGGTACYVTMAGAQFSPVWHFDSARTPQWEQRRGPTAATRLLQQTHHSKIIVDPSAPTRLWVAADIGVWQSTDGGATWNPFSNNLPDAAVVDLDLHPSPPRMLRAATHGRGVFEIPVDATPQPAVELTIRTNRMDTGRGALPVAPVLDPLDQSVTLGVDQSPDICTDPPDGDGRLVADPATIDPVIMTRDLVPIDRRILANAAGAGADAITKVYVRVRNRGHVVADGVQVMLLVGRSDGVRAALPAGYQNGVAAGTPINNADWSTVGFRTLDGVGSGKPGIAVFDLRSSVLAAAGESDGHKLPLLALVSHPDDAYNSATNVIDVLATERRAALTMATVGTASGAAASGVIAPPVGADATASDPTATADATPRPSRMTGPATALLAHQRLTDVVDGLESKVNSGRVTAARGGFPRVSQATRTEHQVLALAKRARAMFEAGPAVPAPATSPSTGTGTFALLGSVGYDVTANVSLFEPGGAWIVDSMRRGTPDAHRSLVSVAAAELVLSIAAKAKQETTNTDEHDRIHAFTMGMLSSTAAGVLVNPQLADLVAKDTNLDWGPDVASSGGSAVDALIVERLFGVTAGADLSRWWPAVDQVPEALWTGMRKALETDLNLPDGRKLGFAEFQDGFDPAWITEKRLENAYALWRGDLSMGNMHWTGWWGWASLFTLASPLSLLICKALDHGKSVFEPDVPFDERAVFDVLISGMGAGSIGPFVSSMALWSAIDEHTDPFVEALLLFLAKAVITGVAWGTSGDEDQEAMTRWLGMFTPMVAADVYAAIRSIAAGNQPPGDRYVFAMQTASSVNGVLALAVGAVMHAIADETDEEGWAWLAWVVHTLGMFFGVGIPVGHALERGGGWRNWFLLDGPTASITDGLRNAGLPFPEPTALARTYDESTLWPDPQTGAAADPDLEHLAYPSGMRGLARIWKESDDLDVQHDRDTITLVVSGAAPAVVSIPYTGLTASELVTALQNSGVPDLMVTAIGPGDPDYLLPTPETVNDPGDDGPLSDHEATRLQFIKVGQDEKGSYVIRHAPRAELSTRQGFAGASRSDLDEFPVVPLATLGNLESSGLGASADLAVLLAIGAVPSLGGGTVAIPADEWAARFGATGQQVSEIHQVFRRWNLGERRSNEWNQVVTGGARSEKRGNASVTDPLTRPYQGGRTSPADTGSEFADAMGWLPLWRTWLRVAKDPGADGDAAIAMPYAPVVRLADGTRRQLTNNELTLGVRFLLDLEA